MTAARLADRDGTIPDPDHPSLHRFVEAQRIYAAACAPTHRADVLVDNANLDAPTLLRPAS